MTNGRKASIDAPENVTCLSCPVKSLCLTSGLVPGEIAQLGSIIQPPVAVESRETLVTQGMPFNSLYAVRTGMLKQVVTRESDEQLITSLFLPGEIAGMEAIGTGVYPGTLLALETTFVCEIPYEKLSHLCGQSTGVCQGIQRLLSQKLHDERLRLHSLLNQTADARLATFLVTFSEHFQRRGYSPYHFRLPLSQSDIGCYLGLSQETVSRIMMKYQRQKLLLIRGREFQILDLERLKWLAESSGRRKKQ